MSKSERPSPAAGAGSGSGNYCGRMLERLQSRRLFKRVYQERVQNFEGLNVRGKLLSSGGNPKDDQERRTGEVLKKEIEKNLSAVLTRHFSRSGAGRVDAADVILNVFDIKSVKDTSRNDEPGIMIATRGAPRFFQDESALFASISDSYMEAFVEVYAPAPDAWSDRTQRSKWLTALSEPVRETIEATLRSASEGEM